MICNVISQVEDILKELGELRFLDEKVVFRKEFPRLKAMSFPLPPRLRRRLSDFDVAKEAEIKKASGRRTLSHFHIEKEKKTD